MPHWFLLSAIGRDKPGLVVELAQLIYDADANLEHSRKTIHASDFAEILLCSSSSAATADDISLGAKRLEREHGLTILLRTLDGGPRPSIPAPGTRLYTLAAAGEDRAGIVVSICRILADRSVNIADLSTASRPGPGGSPHYELRMQIEIPETLDPKRLRSDLEAEADRLVIDVALMPRT